MINVIIIDVVFTVTLVYVALSRGLEAALPFFTFVLFVVPEASQIVIPGVFDLTTQRLEIITFAVLYLAIGRRKNGVKSITLERLMTASIVWSFFCTADSIVFSTSLKTVLSQLLDYFLVYYLVSRTISSVNSVHKIISAIVAAMAFCGVLGWIEIHYLWSITDLFPTVVYRFGESGVSFDEQRGLRISASFSNPILYGAAIAMVIPLVFYLISVARTKGQRTYLWLALMLMFFNIYKTTSRGPWLALILGTLPLLVVGSVKLKKYILVVMLLTVSVLLIRPGVWETLKNTYMATFDPDSPEGGSYQYRYDLAHAARERLNNDPSRAILGFGPESFYWAGIWGIDSTTGLMFHFESCDSAFVELMVDTGYVGMILTCSMILYAAWICYRSYRRFSKQEKSLCLTLLINIMQFFFMMSSVMIYGWGLQSYLFWILVALVVACVQLVPRELIDRDEQTAMSQSYFALNSAAV